MYVQYPSLPFSLFRTMPLILFLRLCLSVFGFSDLFLVRVRMTSSLVRLVFICCLAFIIFCFDFLDKDKS